MCQLWESLHACVYMLVRVPARWCDVPIKFSFSFIFPLSIYRMQMTQRGLFPSHIEALFPLFLTTQPH